MPPKRKAVPPTKRMTSYRERMRSAGLRPIQIWVPDTRNPAFAETCRQQARAVAAGDPAGDGIMDDIETMRDWPDA